MSVCMRGAVYILVLAAFALDCSAQTLADVARRERERKQNLHSTVVIVNGAATTAAASTSSTSSSASSAAAPSAASAAQKPAGPTDNKGHDEKYWRTQFQKARADLKAAEDKAQLLDLKMKDLNTQLLRQSDVYNRENRLGPELTDTQKQLDDARKQVDQAKQKITDLEDELRRSGGPPGWSR
jgi:chromosome segregation ATPase